MSAILLTVLVVAAEPPAETTVITPPYVETTQTWGYEVQTVRIENGNAPPVWLNIYVPRMKEAKSTVDGKTPVDFGRVFSVLATVSFSGVLCLGLWWLVYRCHRPKVPSESQDKKDVRQSEQYHQNCSYVSPKGADPADVSKIHTTL